MLTFPGSVNFTTVSGLLPFTEYTILLESCTAIGCANSSSTNGQTLPDAPSGLAPPTLTVLGPSSILARWQLPANPNGMITRFELRRLLTPPDPTSFMVVFNDVDLDFETTITGLLPDTTYSFQLLAFNAGGLASSSIVMALTLEDIPDEISPPVVDAASSNSLVLSWSPPGIPNGDIILYNLTLNGEVIFSTEQDLSFAVENLQPFTLYSLAIIACTVQGCGSSNDTVAMTLEDVAMGYVEPNVTSISPYNITLAINPVSSPNGVVTYLLSITGDFESLATGVVESGQRVVYNSTVVGSMVVVSDLIPFTNYTLTLEIRNSAGVLSGPPFYVQTGSTGMVL